MAGERVLLVDDEEEFTSALSQRMELRGLKVEVAKDGSIALARIQKKNFDAIVLDMVMPGMDGLETLKRMRTINSNLQIIVLTGHAKLDQGIQAMKLGALDFMEKPVGIDALIKKITEAWEKKQDLDEQKVDDTLSEIMKKKGW